MLIKLLVVLPREWLIVTVTSTGSSGFVCLFVHDRIELFVVNME